ncbi:MAG: hypothetical protein WD426_10255, partial [Anditalea sp.]
HKSTDLQSVPVGRFGIPPKLILVMIFLKDFLDCHNGWQNYTLLLKIQSNRKKFLLFFDHFHLMFSISAH